MNNKISDNKVHASSVIDGFQREKNEYYFVKNRGMQNPNTTV